MTDASDSFGMTDCEKNSALMCAFPQEVPGVIAGELQTVTLSKANAKAQGSQIDCRILRRGQRGKR